MRVILFLLKCAVGLLASIGVLVVALGLVAGLGWQRLAEWRGPAAEVPEQAVLAVDLTAGVVEQPPSTPFAPLADGGVVLRDLVETLDAAARDERIQALTVRLGRGAVGLAQAQDIHAAIERFRESGKPAHVFAETIGGMGGAAQGTTHAYLTSAFDKVWLQPSGEFALLGFNMETPYLREALAELGITPQLGQREAYKGAANQMLDREMPEGQRANLQRMLDSWLDGVVAALAEGRGLAPEAVRQALAQAPLSAQAARAAGFVDRLGYRGQAAAAVKKAAGDAAATIALPVYANLRPQPEADAPRIAVIHGTGAVTLGESDTPGLGGTVMGSDTVVSALRTALDDQAIQAIVLRIDSPGGSYVASDAIWRAVQEARAADKPLVVSMGNIAASGGYFVAAPANRIVAQPGTLTGSIGVVSGKFVLTGLWDKLHLNFDGVQAGPRADFWSPQTPFSDEAWQKLQESLDESYADFKNKVAEGRGLNPAAVRDAAQGKVWSGADAHSRGLVDVLGGYRRAVDEARKLAEIDPAREVRTVVLPEPVPPFRRLLEQALAGRIDSPAARLLARLDRHLGPLLDLARRIEGSPRGPRLDTPAAARAAAHAAAQRQHQP